MVIIIITKLKVGTGRWINTSYNIIGRFQLGPRSALPNFNDESPPPQMRMGIREGTAGRLKNFYKTRDGHMYKYNISEQVPPVWLILSSRCCCGLSPSPHPASELRSGWARESTCVVTIPSMIHWTGTYHVGYKQLRKLNLILFIIITNNNNIYFNVPAEITSRSPSGYLAKYV